MGLFGKFFDKKSCDICGGEIGILGNRKLEDGNLCKNCAAKLSPWFSERRRSTVEQIREQLDYREANREEVAHFNTTRTLGGHTRVLLDEDNGKFMVTSARNLQEANPDVMDYSQVTGCKLDINERRTELKRKDKDGKSVSFVPPRYEYEYDFYVVINVNHPYFDEIRFQLNDSSITITPPSGSTGNTVGAIARSNLEYQEAQRNGNEIIRALTQVRQQVRREAAAAAAPKKAVTCPWCGATTTPDASGCCEYCGGSVNG